MTTTVKQVKPTDEYRHAPAPPDGGWGWMIVFASFMVHVIFDGITYSFGMFYNEFLEYFQQGKGMTSWILTLLVAVTNFSGPVVSVLVNRYGARLITIAGAFLSSFSLAISYFAQNVPTLYLTIGVGLGLGIGLMCLPAIVSVTTWFEKRRSLATGVAVCGSGVGTVIFAPLITKLLAEHGWKVSMLILAITVLSCVFFGALFRPLKAVTRRTARKPTLESIPELSDFAIAAGIEGTSRASKLKIALRRKSGGNKPKKYKHGPLDKPDVFYKGKLKNIPAHRRKLYLSEEIGADGRLSTFPYKKRRSSFRDNMKTTVIGIPCAPESKHLLKEMFGLELFKDRIFIVFVVSNFLTWLGLNIPYLYIVPKARTVDLDSYQAAYLISIIGVANTVSRFVLGFICDISWINRKQVYIWCLTICGVATIACAYLENFNHLAIYCGVFGFTIGAYVGLSTVVLVDLIGLDKLTNGFGHMSIFAGFASLIGAPIAGWCYDISGSYKPAFYFGGITLALSGLVLFLIYPLQNKSKNREAENKHDIGDLRIDP